VVRHRRERDVVSARPAAGRWWVAAAALAAVAVTAAAAVPVLAPRYAFPPPSGPYGIGTVAYHWVDTARPDALAADATAPRELMVQLWYPADPDPDAPRAPYLTDAAAVQTAMAGLHGYPRFVLAGLGSATADAVASATPATDRPRFPVLVFLEGLTGYRQMNTFQVEELVSHGYVVAGIDQPAVAADVVLPDGRHTGTVPVADMKALLEPDFGPVDTVPTAYGRPFPHGVVAVLARDVGFVLDRLADVGRADPNGLLTGRLDLDRTGLFGVSMGGIVGAEACRTDPRLRACLLLDSRMPTDVVADGLPQPAMWLTRDAASMQREGWSQADVDQHQQTMAAAFAAAHADAYLVRIPGTFHADFTDIPGVLPLARSVGLAGPIGVERAHAVINAYSRAFFDRYLGGAAAPLLDAPGDPGIRIDRRSS
jgi:hypothetical protein